MGIMATGTLASGKRTVHARCGQIVADLGVAPRAQGALVLLQKPLLAGFVGQMTAETVSLGGGLVTYGLGFEIPLMAIPAGRVARFAQQFACAGPRDMGGMATQTVTLACRVVNSALDDLFLLGIDELEFMAASTERQGRHLHHPCMIGGMGIVAGTTFAVAGRWMGAIH